MIYQSDSLDTKFQIILVRLEIFKKENKGINKKGGDIEGYLEEFCRWQSKQNPKTSSHPDHWDHGLLLTGVNLYDGLKKYSSVIGNYKSYYLCSTYLENSDFYFCFFVLILKKVWLGFLVCVIPNIVVPSTKAIILNLFMSSPMKWVTTWV